MATVQLFVDMCDDSFQFLRLGGTHVAQCLVKALRQLLLFGQLAVGAVDDLVVGIECLGVSLLKSLLAFLLGFLQTVLEVFDLVLDLRVVQQDFRDKSFILCHKKSGIFVFKYKYTTYSSCAKILILRRYRHQNYPCEQCYHYNIHT